MRRLSVLGVVVVAAVTGGGAPRAQTPPAPTTRVWTSTWEEHDAWAGRSVVGRSQAQITATYVEGRDEFGGKRWVSRRLTWSAEWEETRFDQLIIATVGGADERGTIQNRYPADIVQRCAGSGTLELGPAVGGSGDDLTPAQKDQLRVPSVITYHPRDGSVPAPEPKTGTCELLQVLGMPNEDELTGCSYEKAWPKGGRPAGSMSVSVSAPVTARIDADPAGEYGRFVPIPGQTLTFVARAPAGTARFRFELDPKGTSRFPGYATNANVDDTFFVKHNLGRLIGQYANDDPDFIFDPEHFSANLWSRRDRTVVETRTAESAVVVTVTAMDYGAVGELRGFVKSDECGDWQPIPVSLGRETRDAIAIPLDEDHNLMADALAEYRGLEPGADTDNDPDGSPVQGDGMTAFEEYRGFLTAGPSCDARWTDQHVRAGPRKRDLFIVTEDAIFSRLVPLLGEAFGLAARQLCGRHVVDGTAILNFLPAGYASLDPERGGELTGTPDARVVNFTLQQAALRRWNGHAISHDHPQRAVVIMGFRRTTMAGTADYPLALAIPTEPDLMGPPGATAAVLISNDDLGDDLPDDAPEEQVIETVLLGTFSRLAHEVGHAVGIPHHSDSVDNWRIRFGRKNVVAALSALQRAGSPPDFSTPAETPAVQMLMVEPGPACREDDANAATKSGTFVGCLTSRIVRRGQENSGEFTCPMRYTFSKFAYYEPPGVTTIFRQTDVVEGIPPDAPTKGGMNSGPNFVNLRVDLWAGPLLRYQNERETVPAEAVCRRVAGTGINSGADSSNHSGDLGRTQPCYHFVVVNDTVLGSRRR